MKIAYQGEPGAFSEAAARRVDPDGQLTPCRSFDEVFDAVQAGTVAYGVLPIENSIGGSIHRNYDLLLERTLPIVGEVELPVIHHHLGAAGGVVGGDDLDVGQRAQEALALRKALWMRIDAAQTPERRAREREQVVHDGQLDLADDRQRALEQQVVVAVNAAADRVLDRQDAAGRRAGLDRVEHFVEAPAGQELRVRVNPPGGRLAEGARLALIRDLHRCLTITRQDSLEVKLIIFT